MDNYGNSFPFKKDQFLSWSFILYHHVKDHRQAPFPFVDDAKLGTKKMRSNLLKRIRKHISVSVTDFSKNRWNTYRTSVTASVRIIYFPSENPAAQSRA